MYRLLLLFTAALSVISCTSKYEIKGTSSVSVLDGRMLYVRVLSDSGLVAVDSAEIVHGNFRMKGVTDSTMLATLYMDDESIMPFVLEKGEITIRIEQIGIDITGTPLNDKLTDFIKSKTELDDRAYEIERTESRMIMDGADPAKIQQTISAQRNELSLEMDRLIADFIKANYANVLGPGIFMMIANAYPYPVLTPLMRDILKDAPESFKEHSYIKKYVAAARRNMQKMPSPMRGMTSDRSH